MQHLNVHELKTRLDAGGETPQIIDVREPWEVQVCALPGAKHIPMRQIPGRLGEIDRERDVVVLCHHGIRSQQVARFLEEQGFQRIINLDGGIDAWAKEVDPGMSKY